MRQNRAAAPTRSWTVVHDFGFVLAGAERVSQALANEVLDGAPLVTIAGTPAVMDAMRVRGGWRALLPPWLSRERTYRALTPLYPALLAWRRPVQGDVLCSSYAFAHYIRCSGRKVVYCHTPLRQVWSGRPAYLDHANSWQRLFLQITTAYLQGQDLRAARSADAYVASSQAVRERVERYYGLRDVAVVAPPLDTSVFKPSPTRRGRDYFLWVGRIVEPYKRLEMTIDAFRGTEHQLLVAGDGRDRARLEALAPSNVRFLGWQGDADLARLYQGARAVVFPSEDDFGLVPVESMACGTPSVAFAGGGAFETLVDGQTGVFFTEQTSGSLRTALERAAAHDWDHERIADVGRGYGMPRFVEQMREALRTVEGLHHGHQAEGVRRT